MISMKDLLQYVDHDFVVTPEMKCNLSLLLATVNPLLDAWDKPVVVTSGLRTPGRNMAVGGSKNSNHMKGLAVDISDFDGSLTGWCIENIELLEKHGIYLEDRRYTPHWIHMQCSAPASGKRIFLP